MTLTRKNRNARRKRERLAISHVNCVAQNLAISFIASCEIGLAMILIIIITLVHEYRTFRTKDFSHKSFSTSFGPFAQFLVVTSHNNYK